VQMKLPYEFTANSDDGKTYVVIALEVMAKAHAGDNQTGPFSFSPVGSDFIRGFSVTWGFT